MKEKVGELLSGMDSRNLGTTTARQTAVFNHVHAVFINHVHAAKTKSVGTANLNKDNFCWYIYIQYTYVHC